MDRSSSWTNAGRNADYVPPSRVARMAVPSPRPPSSAEAVTTARRTEYGAGGSILPILPTASPNASKRTSWTTPRSPSDTTEDEVNQSSDTFAPPPRCAGMAAARRTEPVRQRSVSDGLFASDTEQAQLAYMEQMYGTINLLNAELENERRNRAALEASVAARPSTYSVMSDYSSLDEDVHIPVGDFDEPPTGLVVSQTPVAPSYSPRKLRTMPSPPSHPPQSQYRVARPPLSPRSIVKGQDEELCATLGKNAELRIRSRDMERTVEKTELELELARKQIKMAERRAENREEKLRALLKEKLNWQKELKATRAQVVEEKMRQVDFFREVETAKRHFAAELEAVEQELRTAQEENSQLRAHAAEVKAHMNFQARKMEEMARQAQDEKARFVAMIEDTRHRFREWKEGEAEALVAAHDQVVRNLKTEYELKMERHQDEKQKLREKVNDLEVSMRLLQKDRALSPLELSLRKAAILGSKDNAGTIEAEQIAAQSRILELENLLAHSQEYQLRQESIIKLSEATISRLMQEREVTALENLSLHPFGVEPHLPRGEELSSDTPGYVTAPTSPVRCSSPPGTPSRRNQNPIKTNEPSVRSPRSRPHTPRREDLEASIAEAAESNSLTTQSANSENTVPSSREQSLMDELTELRKALAEAQAKAKAQSAPPKIDNKSTEEEPVEMPEVHGATINSASTDEIAADTEVAEIQSTEANATEPPSSCDDNVVVDNVETNTQNEAMTVGVDVDETLETEDEKHDDESTNDATASDSIDKVPCESPSPSETSPCQNANEDKDSDTIVNSDVLSTEDIDTETNDEVEISAELCKTLGDDNQKESNTAEKYADGDEVQDKPDRQALDSQCKVISDKKDSPNEAIVERGLSNSETIEDAQAWEESTSSPELDATPDNETHVDSDEKEETPNVGSDAKLSEDFEPNMHSSNDTNPDEKEEPPTVADDAKASEDIDSKFHDSNPDEKEVASEVVCDEKLLDNFDSILQESMEEEDNEPSASCEKNEEYAKDVAEQLDEPSEVPNEISLDSAAVDENANEALDPGATDDDHVETVAEDPIQLISCEMIDVVQTSENEISDALENSSNIEAAVDTKDTVVPIEVSDEVLVEPPQMGMSDDFASPDEEIKYGHADASDRSLEIGETLTTEPSDDLAEKPNDLPPPGHDLDENVGSDITSEAPTDSVVDSTSADDTFTAEKSDHEVEVVNVLAETKALEVFSTAVVPLQNETTTLLVETPEACVAKEFVAVVEFTALVLATSLQKAIDTKPLETGIMEELSPVMNATIEDNTFSTAEVINASAEPDTTACSGVNTLMDAEISASSNWNVPISSKIEGVAVDVPNVDTYKMNVAPEEQHFSSDEQLERSLATEANSTSLEMVVETDVVTLVTKTFAENFVKELMEMVESSTPLEDPVETNEDVVALVAKTIAENFVKELIEMIGSTASRNENQELDETVAGQSITTTPGNAVASTDELTPFSENEVDSIEDVVGGVAATVDTMALARDFMDTVESEAMSAVLLSLQNERCSDEKKADSELENEGFESDTTRSIMGSGNVSSEEQNETCNESEASEGLMSENEECGIVDVPSTQDEERLADPDDNAPTTDGLGDTTMVTEIAQILHDCVESVENEVVETFAQPLNDVEVAESNDIEKPTIAEINEFSTQEIVSGVACLFASQAIAEVLNRLTQTCNREDNSDNGAVAESEDVKASGEGVSNQIMRGDIPVVDGSSAKASANEESTLMPAFVDTKLVEERNEGTAIDADNTPCMNSEVIEHATVDIQSEEASHAADSELVVEPDVEIEDIPSVNIDIVQDAGNAADINSEDDDKVVALLLAETVAQVASGETHDIIMEVERIVSEVEKNNSNADLSCGGVSTQLNIIEPNSADEVQPSHEGQTTSDSVDDLARIKHANDRETQDENLSTGDTALPDDIVPAAHADNNLDVEMVPQTADCDVVKPIVGTSIDDAPIDSVMEDIITAIESGNHFEPPGEEIVESFAKPTSNTSLQELDSTTSHESTEAKGAEAPTLSAEASEILETTDSKSEDTNKHGDIEPYAASSFALQPEYDECVVRLTLDSLVDAVANDTRSCSAKVTATGISHSIDVVPDAVSSPDTYHEPTLESEMGNVVVDKHGSVEQTNAQRNRDRARSVHFSSESKEENIDHLKQARRSVLLWKSPIGTACNKEAVESSAKRRASRRRASRRTFADLLAFPTELTRFTASDTTLLAYDARHEQGQICSLLDESILTINPNGRHIHMDDQDERVESRIIGKRKTLMQELHSKNLALRQIPRFNYMPMCIKFQWSDFVVATSVRPSNCNIGEGHVVKSPVEPMRLLQKKGAKLPCGSYVIVSAFIRPLEDGNENLRVQIYDAERVEEFQFDFSEDVMKKYHLETTGMESQSLEFLGHLQFRRDEDTIIIKLPEKRAEAGNDSDTDRLQSERTMVGGGEPPKRDPLPYRQKRPASSPPMTSSQGDSEISSLRELSSSEPLSDTRDIIHPDEASKRNEIANPEPLS